MSHVEENEVEEAPAEPEYKATKAWFGGGLSGVIAFLGSIQNALSDNIITQSEWIGGILAGLVAFAAVTGVVYKVPNNPK